VKRATLDPAHAREIVEARLGRPPQDMLEAAVALEAWGGIPARDALATARAMLRAESVPSLPSVGRLPHGAAQRGVAVEAISFAIAVVAIACWAAPLRGTLGAAVVEQALTVALPLSLALQWALASRYLGRPGGLTHLGARPRVLAAAGLALVALPAAAMGRSGAVAGLLTLIWTGGAIVIRRGWSPLYAAVVIAATAVMLAAVSAPAVLVGAAALTIGIVGAAVRGPVPLDAPAPGRSGRALAAGAIGCGLGALLVADPTVDWSVGAMPAVALLPSSLAAFWGGTYLWRFQRAMPETLSGVAVLDERVRGLARAPLRVLAGAVARVVLLTAALSVLLLAVADAAGIATRGETVLAGFGLVALATMLVGLLESIGRARWAFAGVAAGVAVELAAPGDLVRVPGGALIAGAAIAVLVVLPAVVAALARPALTFATSIGIR
jgi:hypothetical protein